MVWLLGMLVGCGGADRVEACNQLVGIVNPTISALAASASYDSSDYAESRARLDEMTATATGAAEQTRALQQSLRDEALRSHAARYATLCDAIAAATAEMSQAMTQAQDATARAEQIEGAMQQSVDGIVAACKPAGRAAACAPVMAALVKLPETFTDVAVIQTHRDALAATRGDDPALQAAVDGFTDLLERTRVLHEEIAALQGTADAAHARMTAASEEQEQIVDGINADCQG